MAGWQIYTGAHKGAPVVEKDEGEPDPLRDYRRTLENVMAPQVISSWLEIVAVTAAGEMCARPDGVRYEKDEASWPFGRLVAPTAEGRECLIRAIDRHIGGAPEAARKVLAMYRDELKDMADGK